MKDVDREICWTCSGWKSLGNGPCPTRHGTGYEPVAKAAVKTVTAQATYSIPIKLATRAFLTNAARRLIERLL